MKLHLADNSPSHMVPVCFWGHVTRIVINLVCAGAEVFAVHSTQCLTTLDLLDGLKNGMGVGMVCDQ